MKANSTHLIKKANRCLVLNTIMEYEPMTIEDIVYKTRLSRPTVLNLIKDLTIDKIIIKSGFEETMGGRHPALYSFNTKFYFVMGIDLDLPPARLTISDLKGRNIYSRKWEIGLDSDINAIIESLVNNIEESLKESHIDKTSVIGIGVGIPGIVDTRENNAVKIDRVHGWINVPINKILNEKTGINIFIRNDAHLLAMVEKRMLNIKGENFLYVVHRSGIGMAVFINNSLYEGAHGNSGYLGHASININGEKCECGKAGCLEIYCSKRAVINNYLIQNNPKKSSNYSSLTFNDILIKADNGDKIAYKILQEAGRHLGLGISNAIKLFDVSTVIIGDLICNKNNIFFTSIYDTIKTNTNLYAINEINLRLGKLSDETYGLGGCYFVIDKFFNEPVFKLRL